MKFSHRAVMAVFFVGCAVVVFTIPSGAVKAQEGDGCYCAVMDAAAEGPPDLGNSKLVPGLGNADCTDGVREGKRYSGCEWKTSASASGDPLKEDGGGAYVLPRGIGTLNRLGVGSIPALIGRILGVVIGVVGSIALAMFVYGGAMWMLSGGNAERTKKAGQIIVWSSLGLAVILASYVIVQYIFDVFS